MENIRNFVILAHIDHGKSTLADRLLELTGTIELKKMRPQFLDMMPLERERGITIKMQPVRMKFENYILNLIDTPGHVDFSYEVSRALAAVEGAILLVDATKGIQAQTIGNLELAKNQNLAVIPVINKIDSPQANVAQTQKEIAELLKVDPSGIISVSAKSGANVEQVIKVVIDKFSSPKNKENEPFQALVFDSKYDSYKGVIAYVRVFSGSIKKGDKIFLMQSQAAGEAKEVGVFKPEMFSCGNLGSGEIGYVATGIKVPGQVKVGDTIAHSVFEGEPLPGYKEPKPMVFLSVYPQESEDFELLKNSLERLRLNDAALTFKPDFKDGLGRGFQCGLLGLLHAEIVAERLKREFGLNLILSTPSVVYKVRTSKEKEIIVYTSADWPDQSEITGSQELWIELKVLCPMSHLGHTLELLETIESKQLKTEYLAEKAQLTYEVPLREVVTKNLYDKLKGVSQGFASMNYEITGWREAELAKLDILILGRKEEAFSRIVPIKEAELEGRRAVEKLKEALPPQQFSVPLQAAIGSRIIARETIGARRKDVLAPLYGGDYSRKRKLLERQKKGKKELKEKAMPAGRQGRLKIPSKVFLEIFKN
ncbi:MAG: translation elongation factor 4 [Candidatus Nealsonbacteria bacterium]|nr:translation elongation factor 4 [Candidatus Nealsonbacteria bacterium]